MCDKRKICDKKNIRDRIKEYDKERCDEIIVLEGVQWYNGRKMTVGHNDQKVTGHKYHGYEVG